MGASISFEQVLGRIPELRDMFERSFGKPAANYSGFVFTVSPNTYTEVDLFPGRHNLPPLDQLREELRIPADVVIQEGVAHNFMPSGPHLSYSLAHMATDQNFWDGLPEIDNHADGSISIVAPFPGGFGLSQLGRLFLLSYFLGTLARYHPTTWLAIMQSPQKGDFLLPIIREAMRVIQEGVPLLLIQELQD